MENKKEDGKGRDMQLTNNENYYTKNEPKQALKQLVSGSVRDAVTIFKQQVAKDK